MKILKVMAVSIALAASLTACNSGKTSATDNRGVSVSETVVSQNMEIIPETMDDTGNETEIVGNIDDLQTEIVPATMDSQLTEQPAENNDTLMEQPTEMDAPDLNPVSEQTDVSDINSINIQAGDTVFTATLARNSSVDALKEMLAKGPVTIEMSDYGNMEKVGSLGETLPDNDEPITTQAGDLILYQSSAFVIYYAPNSWEFTRLGKIDNVTAEELKAALGDGDITVTLSLSE